MNKQHDIVVVQNSTMIELANIIAEQSIKIKHLEQMNNMLRKKLDERKNEQEAEDDKQDD